MLSCQTGFSPFLKSQLHGVYSPLKNTLLSDVFESFEAFNLELSLNLVKEHVIHQFLLKENIQNARAFAYAKSWIENIYKNE